MRQRQRDRHLSGFYHSQINSILSIRCILSGISARFAVCLFISDLPAFDSRCSIIYFYSDNGKTSAGLEYAGQNYHAVDKTTDQVRIAKTVMSSCCSALPANSVIFL